MSAPKLLPALRRKRSANAGFTLLELSIVLAVIAILSAILIPTFTDVIRRAEETAARENCRRFYEQLLLASFEDGQYDLDGYIFVSGDYAFTVENGEMREADYTAKDGLLLSADGEAITESDEALGVEKVNTLPSALRQDTVAVYRNEKEGAYIKCSRVWQDYMPELVFQSGTIFAYGRFAFEFNGQELVESTVHPTDGVVPDAELNGRVKYEFPVGADTGGVNVYLTSSQFNSMNR